MSDTSRDAEYDAFLEELARKCETGISESPTELFQRVVTELEMDFPLLTLDDLQQFLLIFDSHHNQFKISNKYVGGLLCAISDLQEPQGQEQTPANPELTTNLLAVFATTILVPLLHQISQQPSQLSEMLSHYCPSEDSHEEESDQSSTRVLLEDSLPSEDPAVDVDELADEEDPDDFIFEPMDTPQNSSFEPVESLCSETLASQFPWEKKLSLILEPVSSLVFPDSLWKSSQLPDLLLKAIGKLFQAYDHQSNASNLIFLEHSISQMSFLLRDWMCREKSQIPLILKNLHSALLCETESKSTKLKHLLWITLMSSLAQDLILELEKNPKSSSQSHVLCASEMILSAPALTLITNRLERMEKLISTKNQSDASSSIVIEFSNIVTMIKLVCRVEGCGKTDSETIDKLIQSGIIGILARLFSVVHLNPLLGSLAFCCRDLFLYMTIYQPSFCGFIQRIKSVMQTIESHAQDFPEFVVCLFVNIYVYSACSDKLNNLRIISGKGKYSENPFQSSSPNFSVQPR
jgi:hypothetical protein